MKRVFAVEENCMACKLCEVACVVEHSTSKNIFIAWKEKPAVVSRTRVVEELPFSYSSQCRHCEQPDCVAACSNAAITKDEQTGIVLIDEKRCVACWMCTMACNYGAIQRNIQPEFQIKNSQKCDLCIDRGYPACVEACPNGALVYEERD